MNMRFTTTCFAFVWAFLYIWRSPAFADKPNFLFIYTDDQRWDALSCVQKEQGEKGRFPWFQTPHMDRIAREGVRFRNAFVVNSLCAPSRSNFVTGQYSHLNGVVNNHTPAPLDRINHATELKKAGYVTGYFGKWHHGQQPERPGFNVYASFLGQGKFIDCPINVNGKTTPSTGWVDDVTTDYAIKFIREHKDKPFDMVVGFKSPHGPRTPPARAAKRFEGEAFRPVPNLTALPPYGTNRKNPAPGPMAKEGQLDYFRTISAVDDCVGRLLDVLDELKLADNTVVIFSSDNGYYLGEHGLGDKRSAYDESLRIPMLVRYPRAVPAGKTLDQMILNIDLAPTLLDLAGVAIPTSMQGRSWKPLFEGKTDNWRKSYFYCYFFERGFTTPTTTALRTDTAKLIKYPGHDEWTELFDLQADPYELKNLYKDPAVKSLRDQLEGEYAAQSKAIGFTIPPYADKEK